MDLRTTKRYAAMLVAGVAGLAPALTGCGGSEPSKTAGTQTNPSSTNPSTSSVPTTVDYNNPSELAAALKSVGVETPATEPIGTERASGPEGLAFPTWPAGDVRKTGLTSFRVDASAAYESDGTLKFMDGHKVLYEAPFKPQLAETVMPIPAIVLESLKSGDTITWGVWFANKKTPPAKLTFKVVDKSGASKEVARLDSDKGLSKLGRDLAKGQSLKNYSLLSEALVIYSAIGKENPTVTSAFTSIMECLRGLHLKNTPAFFDASARNIGQPGNMRGAFSNGPSDRDLAHNGPGMAPVKAPVASTGGGKPSGFDSKSGGLKPTNDPTAPNYNADPVPPTDPTVTDPTTPPVLTPFLSAAKHQADQAAQEAKLAQSNADAAKTNATAMQAAADAAKAKALASLNAANNADPALTPEELAALNQQAAADAAAAAAAQTAANDAAAQAQKAADLAKLAAQHAADLAAAAAGTPGLVAPPGFIPAPAPGGGPIDPTPKPLVLDGLKQNNTNAQNALAAANQAFNNAGVAVGAAQAAYDALKANPASDPTDVVNAKNALDAAKADQATAEAAKLAAQAAADAAAAALAAAGG
jgi:hypothetical protein